MHWALYYQESPHQQLLPVFFSCFILSKHHNVWNSFLSFSLLLFSVCVYLYATNAKQSHYDESLQLPQRQETTIDANNSFLCTFTLPYLLACFTMYMYVCVIDHSLDFVSSHSRSLAVSKQTYLNNKSSIIFYWSDCEIEGKNYTGVWCNNVY